MHRLDRLWRSFAILALAVTLLPALSQSVSTPVALAQIPENSWPMAGANPQRTSWTAEEISPDRFEVAWYRPIEAYIPQNVQVIAANGLLYIDRCGGLYSLDAATGAVACAV